MRAGVRNIPAESSTVESVCNKAALPLLKFDPLTHAKGDLMNNIVYIVGAIVIIVALLSFLGLR